MPIIFPIFYKYGIISAKNGIFLLPISFLYFFCKYGNEYNKYRNTSGMGFSPSIFILKQDRCFHQIKAARKLHFRSTTCCAPYDRRSCTWGAQWAIHIATPQAVRAHSLRLQFHILSSFFPFHFIFFRWIQHRW